MLHAHDPKGKSEVTLVGEVIDTVCYVHHESRGPDHAECARECAEEGIPLAILDEKTGQVYLSLPVDHSNPNSKLVAFIAKRVEVKGTAYTKGGLRGIHVQSVRELASAEKKGKK
jgi:hypothetical protein